MQRQGDTFIKDMTEDDWKSIEEYRLKHPDIEGKWLKYRYAEKIPLNDIGVIIEPTPIVRGMIACVNAHIGEEDGIQKSLEDGSSANFYVTPQTPEEDLKMLLEQEIAFDDKDGQKYVDIFELINWIEKKKTIDPSFVYSLKKPFVEYYRKRHEVKSYDDLKAEILSLQKRCECLEKESEKFSDTPKVKKKKIIQKWVSKIKGYCEKSKIQIAPPQIISLFYDFLEFEVDSQNTVKEKHGKRQISGVSPASVRDYINETGLFTVGKQGKRSPQNEEHMKSIQQLLSSPEYQKFKTEIKEVIFQSMINKKRKKPHLT